MLPRDIRRANLQAIHAVEELRVRKGARPNRSAGVREIIDALARIGEHKSTKYVDQLLLGYQTTGDKTERSPSEQFCDAIERAYHLPPRWMSTEHADPQVAFRERRATPAATAPVLRLPNRRTAAWPFSPDIDPDEIARLPERALGQIEGFMLKVLGDHRKSPASGNGAT